MAIEKISQWSLDHSIRQYKYSQIFIAFPSSFSIFYQKNKKINTLIYIKFSFFTWTAFKISYHKTLPSSLRHHEIKFASRNPLVTCRYFPSSSYKNHWKKRLYKNRWKKRYLSYVHSAWWTKLWYWTLKFWNNPYFTFFQWGESRFYMHCT